MNFFLTFLLCITLGLDIGFSCIQLSLVFAKRLGGKNELIDSFKVQNGCSKPVFDPISTSSVSYHAR